MFKKAWKHTWTAGWIVATVSTTLSTSLADARMRPIWILPGLTSFSTQQLSIEHPHIVSKRSRHILFPGGSIINQARSTMTCQQMTKYGNDKMKYWVSRACHLCRWSPSNRWTEWAVLLEIIPLCSTLASIHAIVVPTWRPYKVSHRSPVNAEKHFEGNADHNADPLHQEKLSDWELMFCSEFPVLTCNEVCFRYHSRSWF